MDLRQKYGRRNKKAQYTWLTGLNPCSWIDVIRNIRRDKSVSAKRAFGRRHIQNTSGRSFYPPTSNCWSAGISLFPQTGVRESSSAPPHEAKIVPFQEDSCLIAKFRLILTQIIHPILYYLNPSTGLNLL